MQEIIIKWREFRQEWDKSHTLGHTIINPSFTDFMDWLINNN